MYKSGFDRDQLALFPTSLQDMIDKNSIVWVIDAFVDSLDLVDFNFKYSTPNKLGNRPYNPKDLLKLYFLSYNKKVRSSRDIMYFARTNIECIWLIKGLTPDHRTISDFRKDNKSNLKKVFYEFNLSLKELGFISNINSQDGTKIKAVNSKDRNYTLNKVDDRIKKLKKHIDDYLDLLDISDNIEDKYDFINDLDNAKKLMDEIDFNLKNDNIDKDTFISELKNYIKKLENYQSVQNYMVSTNKSQISLTDPEAKLMRNNGKFEVCYNNQVLVDENHFVTDFLVTDKPADLGTITEVSSNAKNVYGFDTMTNITDKGYNKREDMVSALENGIIPEVTPEDNQSFYSLETVYEENEITDEMIKSTKPEDIKTCLRSGVIPDVYKDVISDIEVKEFTVAENSNVEFNDDMTEEELRDKAINDYCFTRHLKSGKVFCPMGEILRKKSVGKGGVRYCNKLACQNCKNPCCSSKFKTVDFKDGKNVVVPKNSNLVKSKTKNKKKKVKVTKVLFNLNVDKDLIKKRMSLSELPHAMLKHFRDASYTLLKGIKKVTGECSIYYCSENILHAKNLIGVDNLVEYFQNKKQNILKIAQ